MNYDYSRKGRIWLGWDVSLIKMEVVLITEQLIHVIVEYIHKKHVFALTSVYRLHSMGDRRQL